MPRDPRTYITLHDGMPDNRKIRALSDKGFRTLVELWCWCSREKNDGAFDQDSWGTFGNTKARTELIAKGLVEITSDGFAAHDYLEHQRSRAEIEELTAKRAKAGSAGGRARVANQAFAQASASASAKQPASKVQPETDTETEELPNGSSLGAAKRPSARGTRIPDTFIVTAEMRSWATESAPHVDVNRATEMFVNYWRAKAGRDATKLDWILTWRNWLLSDEEKASRTSSSRQTPTQRAMTTAAAGRAVAGRLVTTLDPKGIES